MKLLLSACLLLAWAAPTPVAAPSAAGSPRPDLSVDRGRVRLLEAGEPRTLLPRSGTRRIGPAYLEGGARSVLRLRWRGQADLTLRGALAGSLLEAPRPTLALAFLRSLDLEVRRGAFELRLPGGRSLLCKRAAIHVRELPDGTLEIVHHGGEPAQLAFEGPRPKEAPERIAPGTRLRLDPPGS